MGDLKSIMLTFGSPSIFKVSIGLSRFARNKKINYLCRNSVKNFKSNT